MCEGITGGRVTGRYASIAIADSARYLDDRLAPLRWCPGQVAVPSRGNTRNYDDLQIGILRRRSGAEHQDVGTDLFSY
jgi:hypothetical protein